MVPTTFGMVAVTGAEAWPGATFQALSYLNSFILILVYEQ